MTVALFMDHHIPRAITMGLRRRDVNVVTAHEDGSHRLEDAELLDRASALNRILVTNDEHFLAEAARRQREAVEFCGVLHLHMLRVTIGQAIIELELIGKAGNPEDFRSKVVYVPL